MPDAEIDVIRAQLAASPRPADMAGRRARMNALGSRYKLPADVRVEPVSANGVAAERTTTPEADASHVLMFLHGGGYVSGSVESHRHLVAQAGREARARTLALGYRLAPEHPFPAAPDDALAGYRFLLAQGIAPRRIALCGESAGGGLAVAAMVSLRDAGDPLPACAWLSSPWTDLGQTGETMRTKDSVDPLIDKPYLDELAAAYLRGTDANNPMVSPIHADLRSLPPFLIRNAARRFRAPCRCRWRCGRARHARYLAGHDPRLHAVLPGGRGRSSGTGEAGGFHPINDKYRVLILVIGRPRSS